MAGPRELRPRSHLRRDALAAEAKRRRRESIPARPTASLFYTHSPAAIRKKRRTAHGWGHPSGRGSPGIASLLTGPSTGGLSWPRPIRRSAIPADGARPGGASRHFFAAQSQRKRTRALHAAGARASRPHLFVASVRRSPRLRASAGFRLSLVAATPRRDLRGSRSFPAHTCPRPADSPVFAEAPGDRVTRERRRLPAAGEPEHGAPAQCAPD